jgi:hypothetical protein
MALPSFFQIGRIPLNERYLRIPESTSCAEGC